MKTILILISLFINVEAYPQSGWFVQPTESNAFLWDISIIDLNNAFISASDGTVYKTTNGGTNWIPFTLQPGGDFFTIDFPSANTGYTAGSQGKIFKTVNQGLNWIQILSPTNSTIQTSFFLNDNTGFVAGGSMNDGEIFKTTNGGANWNEYGPGTAYPQVVSIYFPGTDTGYTAGVNASILKTTNSGINWTIQQSGLQGGNFSSIFFIENNTGYATVPYPNAIIKTTNGGINWNTIYNDSSFFPVLVYFTSVDTGFVVGAITAYNSILKTTNGGVNWTEDVLNFTAHLNSIDFINSNVGYITGEFGRLYKTTNGGSTVGIETNYSNVSYDYELFQNYPNPFNPVTVIRYSLLTTGFISIKVYDVLGNEAATLVNEKKNAGSHEAEFDGTDFPSGVYFYRIEAFGLSDTKSMMLLK